MVPHQALFRNNLRDTSGTREDSIQQTMERMPQGVRRLAVQLRTSIPVDVLWEVLTDYERLETFIPNLVSSRLVYKDGQTVRLQQVGSQQLIGLRFSAQVLLELTEYRPEGLLQFRMLKGDFGVLRAHGEFAVFPRVPHWCTNSPFRDVCMPIGLIEERLQDDLSSNLSAVERKAIAAVRAIEVIPQGDSNPCRLRERECPGLRRWGEP